ncbi:V-set and immunoglobulin domain-containing protein 10 isoform X2 [Ascaphus truei]|uniref:V-set and immunoglobulin domain-containing protein 10 isoform X2 n=1 Tax=Ascaphus truei TaxID=8439 RepID=UPI003F5A6CCA
MGGSRVPTCGLLLGILYIQMWGAPEAIITIVGEVNGSIVLPCSNVTEATRKVAWFKDNTTQAVLAGDHNSSTDARFSRVNGSSLVITSLRIQDEGKYICREGLDMAGYESHIQLLIAGGPYIVSASISPTKTLPNGTIYASRGSNMDFSCSSDSHPEPKMEWVLYRQDKNPELFHTKNGNFLNFSLTHLAPDYQGNHSCSAENPLSGRTESSTLQLLVYYAPDFPMTCQAENSVGFSELLLACSWPGGYPAPMLQWQLEASSLPKRSNGTDTLAASVEHSQLYDGQQFECRGSHLVREDRSEKTCQVQIALPVVHSQPIRTCLLGGNVTLSCSVSGANPPANITWLRNLSHPEVQIQPGEKYRIAQDSSASYLTILNCSRDGDEGYYVCKAENVLGIREINVWLAVNKPHNIVGLVSALLLLFLLAVAIITGIALYCNPETYLKEKLFRSRESDVLVLVDSEEEMEEEEARAESPKDTAVNGLPAANGNVSKHQVMFHQPPDSVSSDLFSEVS